MQAEPPSIPKIVSQHAEEAAFQWLLRDAAAGSAKHGLLQLGRIDERVAAHLDGLQVAGAAGWEACEESLAWKEAGEVFAAAWLALSAASGARIGRVLELAVSRPDLSRAFVAALGWMEWQHVAGRVRDFLEAKDPALRRIGIAAATVHRRATREELRRALEDDDETVRQRALKAAGEMGEIALLPLLRQALSAGGEGERFRAAWSGGLLGDSLLAGDLCHQTLSGNRHAEQACAMAVRCLNPADSARWIADLAKSNLDPRITIKGAGAGGDPVHLPWLLEKMAEPRLARVAGEAFTLITGAELGDEGLSAATPGDFDAGPNDDPEDANVVRDSDEDLPWPEREQVARWWEGNRGSFLPGQRYLLGKPLTRETLQSALESGTQRQRAAAACESAIRDPGKILFNVASPAFRQTTFQLP